jgi:hypothetical protein
MSKGEAKGEIGWVGAVLNRGKSEQGGAKLNKWKFFVA